MAHRFAQILSLSVVLAFLSGSLLYGGTASAATTTLVFGSPVSLTGATSHEGQLTLEGYKLWIKEVNSHGGIKVGNTRY